MHVKVLNLNIHHHHCLSVVVVLVLDVSEIVLLEMDHDWMILEMGHDSISNK